MSSATGALPRRPLGKTGLNVSVIGFGASPLGGVFRTIDEDVGVQAVHEAFKLGINLFDTSPFYGNTKSEEVLGRGLRGLPRDEIIVASKVGRYGQDTFDFSAARVKASVRESLQRLQLDYLDLVQTHDIEFTQLDQIMNETLPALLSLKEEGLVRHIGITGLPLKIFPNVLDRVAPGTVDTVLSYCHYSLNDRTLEGLLPYLQAQGVGIINASVLSMGLLTAQGPPSWHPAPKEVQEACRKAAALASSKGYNISALAIKQAVANPAIATHLVGCSSPEEVRRNVATVQEAFGEQIGAESEVLTEIIKILGPIQGVGWPSGLPENN